MNYNVICLLLSLAVIIILVYSIIKQKELFYNETPNLSNVKSLSSIIDGTVINIERTSIDGQIFIPVDKSGNYLSIGEGNNIVLSKKKDDRSKWVLLNGLDDKTSDLYSIISYNTKDQQKKLILVYNSNSGNLFSTEYNDRNIGNIPLQIYTWALRTTEVPRKQLKIVDIYNSPIGPIKSNYSSDDPNSISLNLNVNNDILNKILGNNDDNVTNKVCEDYLSKDAVCSICPGCCNNI